MNRITHLWKKLLYKLGFNKHTSILINQIDKNEVVTSIVAEDAVLYTWSGYRKKGRDYTWVTWCILDEEDDDQSS